ncbi:RNA polymerase sigma-54 factor RpoN [Enhygromyxa salina]|uniref:RNA polymerase sigma-54 factor RpoN n=1 Tax=Enhygromyxa salina TaxID=215803 RepID=A0A0C1ZPY0_9BACT|nr:sigma-70 family RNA polymerase sigma factor [Enhygromyxa salina]KIG13063.1 RNA polymerase sigma-54 factor RpoN [Enhygromyxa salina]
MEAAARREFEQTALPLINNLYGAAMRLTRDPAEAEDLVQDAMVRAFRFWSSFQQGTNIKAWMFTILRNTFINGYHRRGRKRSFQNDVSAQVRSLGPAVAVGNSTSPPGPEEAMASRITHARIREALESLPIDYRTAVTLADLEGLSYKEIADVMECPIGTVMSRIYRGRKILHKLLYDHALEIGMVDEDDPPAGERESTRRKPPKSAAQAKRAKRAERAETTEKLSKNPDAVDLAAYRDARKNA